jgi:hypothetical protein
MSIKLLANVLHDGTEYKVGAIIDGIEDAICENIVNRGLAEKTDEAATHVVTPGGVNVTDAAPAVANEDGTAPKSQYEVNQIAGPVVPATGDAEVTQPPAEAAPVAPPAADQAQTNQLSPEEQAKLNAKVAAEADGVN